MLPLPILNVHLQACPEEWQQMTPVAQGHHCAQCNRTILDFTSGTQAELEAAFRTSPDGRVCGRFRPEQLAPTPRLRPKLRRFLVALVLVCGLGLTGREAAAQMVYDITTTTSKFTPISTFSRNALRLNPVASTAQQTVFLGTVTERIPVFPGGQKALELYLQNNLRYPQGATSTGQVWATFIITSTGKVSKVTIQKGLEPLLDKEVVRVISQMPPWELGRQANKPSEVQYILPITFTPR